MNLLSWLDGDQGLMKLGLQTLQNQRDFDTSVKGLVAPSGIDEKLYNEWSKENNLEGIIFQPEEWIIYHQYECLVLNH